MFVNKKKKKAAKKDAKAAKAKPPWRAIASTECVPAPPGPTHPQVHA